MVGYSVRLARDNARLCIRILLWPALVELVGKIIILIGINALINSGPNHIFAVAGGLFTCLIGGAIGMGAEFFMTLRQLALFRLLAGYDSNFQSAYKFVWAKKFQLLGAMALTYFLTTAAVGVWVIEMTLSAVIMASKAFILVGFIGTCIGLVGIIFSLIWTFLPVMFIAPALAIEDRPLSKMLGWSFKLSFKTIFRSTGFLLLITIVLFILSSVLNIPPSVLSAVEMARQYMGEHVIPKAPNLYVSIFASVWRSAANMVLSPMVFFAMGLYYLDLRMRTEGLDITRRLESLPRPAVSSF